ncbi:MFS transporter [Amycolatopsis alkalitolerans]|uniref:MFS transporter n=1 Tax=Amycolatopsis alkalitolerans TaxID=2547244 RepID=A0A5C4M3N0_9PSEU|nr:MFS transporter [Amycolatopsis alkalitolerans]TNC25764.1 MFS transporter [Amycolatopsis alkalitolerans]
MAEPPDAMASSRLRDDANLLSRLDRAPVTRALKIGIGVLILVWLIESFDIGIVSTLIVILKPHWHLDSMQTGLLGASGTIGLVIGIVPAGRLADKFGRKAVLLAGTAEFALFTMLGAAAHDFWTLFALRVIAGLGEGALFPVPYMIISELVSKRLRGTVMGYAQWVLNGGYTLPALVGIWVVTAFPVEWSWRVPLLLGGFPLLLIPALIIWVPETPRFLLKRAELRGRPADRDKVRRLVERIETEARLPHDTTIVDSGALQVLTTTASRDVRMRTLLARPYLSRSLIAYAALTSSFVIWYTMLTYAPTIFKGLLHATSSTSLLYTAIMMFISAFGVFFQGRWADRFGRKRIFAIYILVAAIGMVVLPAYKALGISVVIVAGVLVAWFGLGSFSIPKMYLAEQYPTRLRGLGTSTGEMVSRALTGGLLIYLLPAMFASWGVATVFICAAVVMVLLVVPMIFFGQETAGRNMEELGTATKPRAGSGGATANSGLGTDGTVTASER